MLPCMSLLELAPKHTELIAQSVPKGAANIQDIYPLAPVQEEVLFHHLLTKEIADTYVASIVLSVSSWDRLEDLIAALQAVIDRHDALRTAVLWERLPEPVQVVYRHAILPVQEIPLARDRNPMEQIREWLRPERQRIDLCNAPQMRLKVAPHPYSGQWYAWIQFHQMTIDYASTELVASEVVAHLEDRIQQLPEPIPYRTYLVEALAHAAWPDAENFFRRKFGEVGEPTAPFGLLDVHGDGTHMAEARRKLGPALSQHVHAMASHLSVNAATLFHAVWGLVVARTCGRDNVVFGSVRSGRLQSGTIALRMLGKFNNALPLRLKLRDATTRAFVEQTRQEIVELSNYESVSLAVAQRCSGIGGLVPLFSSLLNYRHSVPNLDNHWSSAIGIRVLASQERTNYPIALIVDDLEEGFLLTAQTDQRIDPNLITDYVHTAIQSLLNALEKAPLTPVLALSIFR